jgi:membrane protease YdiL (CAAX protease family)
MSQEATDVSEQSPRPALPVVRGHPLFSWAVVAAVVAFILYRHVVTEATAQTRYDAVMFELQARYIVGVADILRQRNKSLLGHAETLAGHSYEQRLRFAVIAGELAGPEEALRRLHDLPDDTGGDEETAAALEEIYRSEAAKPPRTVPASDAQRVRERLGWFGELAAAPPDSSDAEARAAALRPARRTAIVLLSAGACALLGVALGALVLAVTAVLTATGDVPPQFVTGSPYGGVYAETFALWMVLFVGISLATSFVPWQGPRMLVAGLSMFASLAALVWPLARGVPWHVLRYDIGWGVGRRPGMELLAGVGTYAAALPFMVVGLLMTLAVVAFAKRLGHPQEILGHPLAPYLVQSDWWGRLQALLAASVAAPIVEETMFRGVLYRHLREGTAGHGRVVSVLLSALAASFVFAVLHPQGWLALPPLMGLAFAFCLAREWRGTLLAPMVAHSIQNTAITMLVILAAS